jgi:acyl-CoA dehydrogenase family protein 9
VAPEYGGQGLWQTGYCRVMEEFGGYDASLSVVMGVSWGVHHSIGMKPIHLFGRRPHTRRVRVDRARRRLGHAGHHHPRGAPDRRLLSAQRREAVDRQRRQRHRVRVRPQRPRPRRVHQSKRASPASTRQSASTPWGCAATTYDGSHSATCASPRTTSFGKPDDGLRIAMHTLNNGRMSLAPVSSALPNGSSNWPSTTPAQGSSSAGR